MTDLAGIRVVCFVPSDIKLISNLVEQIFYIDWENSTDKFKELVEKHRFGYRGKNYVVRFKEKMLKDADQYEKFKDICFEIQIRTLLDYSWGEIEHDRRYETAEELPKDSDIPRRFELISGTLEILDYEFERLSKETELYADGISNRISKGDLDIPISPYSLRKFLTFNFRDIPGFREYFIAVDDVLDEMASMEIKTIAQLNAIIPEGFKENIGKYQSQKISLPFLL
jgi:putative GTP pyrophosphokinase